MVILLQPGCLDGLTDPIRRRDLLQSLGEARYRGHHHIAGPPLLLEDLAQTLGLSASAADGWRTAARWSIKNLTRCRSLTPRVELHQERPAVDRPLESVHHLAPTDPGIEALFSRATLGGEDADDARYLRALAQIWLLSKPSHPPTEDSSLALDLMSLGGNTAATTACTHLNNHRALLAVADSDRGAPEESLHKNKPAALLENAAAAWRDEYPGHAPFATLVLPCYSIENLLLADIVAGLEPRHGLTDADILGDACSLGLFLSAGGQSTALRYLPLSGKNLCEGWLLAPTGKPRADALRREAHATLSARRSDRPPRDPACAAPCGPTVAKEPPRACHWVRSVGKALLPAVADAAEQSLARHRDPTPLIKMLPLHEPWLTAFLATIAAWGLAPRAPYATPNP